MTDKQKILDQLNEALKQLVGQGLNDLAPQDAEYASNLMMRDAVYFQVTCKFPHPDVLVKMVRYDNAVDPVTILEVKPRAH